MKISIGLRLFFAVLCSICTVVLLIVVLIRANVSTGFADYALKIELDRMRDMSESLQARYAQEHDWRFLPADAEEREMWIARELLRLYAEKNPGTTDSNAMRDADISLSKSTLSKVEKIPKATEDQPPIANSIRPAAPVPPAKPHTIAGEVMPPEVAMMPPLPPPPPMAPMAPMAPRRPPKLVAPPAPPASAMSAATNMGTTDLKKTALDFSMLPELFARISLLDAKMQYLAGRPLDQKKSASRALKLNNEIIGYVQITQSNLPSDSMAQVFLQEQSRNLSFILGLSVLLSGIAAVLLAQHFRLPIQALTQGAAQLAAGHYDTRLAEQRSDELGMLAQSFNQLADKLEKAEASRRQWVADTSHELRTPISVLRAQLEAMQDGVRPMTSDSIALMLRQVLALNRLIDELYVLAKSDIGALSYQMQSCDLWQLVQDEVRAFDDKLHAAQLQLIFENSFENSSEKTPTRSLVLADPARLAQVLRNLLENAIRYTDAGGKIKISARSEGAELLLQIEDSAPNVPDAALSQLSERFYRVDASRNRAHGGAGLGLALCARLLEAHRGRMVFSHSSLGGLSVCVVLPLEK